MADLIPELYQLVGAALRDVAQARFMADVFSRQISFVYEGDGVLRHFPVPRVEIDEAEITLHFTIREVAVDPQRHSSRNAAIGALFDRYSTRIVRETMQLIRDETRNIAATADVDTQNALISFEKRFLTDENRDLFAGRLVQYFNESVERIIGGDGALDVVTVISDLDSEVSRSVLQQRETETLKAHLAEGRWQTLLGGIHARYEQLIKALGDDIAKLRDWYPDYKLVIDPSAAALAAPGAALSSIKIKSSVRNYKWSKVDVDDADLRNIRSLSPE